MSDQLSAGKKAGSRFGLFVKNNSYVWLAFFASAALMLFMFFCMKMAPFGERTILRMDLYHQYGPLFAELYERLVGGRSLLYSWNTGLGGNFLGNFFNYLSSPTGLLVLLFGHKNIPEAISVMVLVKCAFASGAFAYLLRKVYGKSDASIAAFGVLYSFCSFFIAYYWNVMWIDAMALLPLVILGIYNIVHSRKFMLYTITLALTLIANYYMGFMVCIFSVLFFLVEYFSSRQPAQNDIRFDEKPPLFTTQANAKAPSSQNGLVKTWITFGYASLLAGALAAVALVPVYFALKSSSATSGDFNGEVTTYFSIFDFLANHFADIKPTIRSSGGDVLPNVYCGVAMLVLVPLYLFVPKIKLREKAAHVLLLVLLFFSFNTNILNYIWHAKHFPNDLPYRFSFLYSFLLLWIAYKVFINLRDVPVRVIVSVGGLAALFAVVVEKVGSKNLQTASSDTTGNTIYLTIALLAVYVLLFAVIRRTSSKAKLASLSMLMLCCVVVEVCAADVKNFEITQVKENYTVDLVDFQKVKKDLQKSDDSFYRMELTDLRTRMDPAWFDYNGVSTFSSMAYEKTANLQSRLGLGSNFINSYTYNPNTPVYNAMHSLKYLVENQNYESTYAGSTYLGILSDEIYTERSEFTRARFTVFENNYHLPIGFWVSDDLREWDTADGTDPFRVQSDFWALSGAGEDVFRTVPAGLSSIDNGNETQAEFTNNYLTYENKPEKADGIISCELTVEETQNVYIHVDASYATLKVDLPDGGVAWRSHDSQAIWDLGVVTPEQPLTFDIYLDKDDAPASSGFFVRCMGLNMDVFEQGYETLQQGALQLKSHSDTLLQGSIYAPSAGLLYTSIPYDEGWQVLVDGKTVPVKDYVAIGDGNPETDPGGLLGVPLEQGEHTIVLRYVPQGLYYGAIISSAALILLAFTGLLMELLRRRKEGKQPPAEQAADMFSTANLNPEDFSLDVQWEEPPPIAAPPPQAPEEDALPEQNGEDAAPAAAQEGDAPPEGTGETVSINSMLQEMQARAEELRRKMQVESKPDDGDDDEGPSFKLV